MKALLHVYIGWLSSILSVQNPVNQPFELTCQPKYADWNIVYIYT